MNSIPTLFEALFKFTEKKLRYPHLHLVDKDFEVLVKKKKCSPLSFLRNLLSMLRGGIKFIMCFLQEYLFQLDVLQKLIRPHDFWIVTNQAYIMLLSTYTTCLFICFLREKDLLLLNFSIKKLSCSCWQCQDMLARVPSL